MAHEQDMKEREIAFATAYGHLNEGQKRAVDTIEGPVMVMAGPGTGKTQVLTLRIANILKKTDTPPDSILALTFTNAGVSAMRERLKRFMGNDAYRVNIHTFHNYATSVIDAHPDRFPRVIGAAPADDIDRFEIVRVAISDEGMASLRPPGNPEYYIRPILKLIDAMKKDRVSVDAYREYVKNVEGADAYSDDDEPTTKLVRSEALVTVYERYEAGLRSHGLYDYADMLLELIRALEENDELRFELAESALYILADEHQDANGSQNRILELLASAHPDNSPNLFIVGDDKQAIYRFQGASLENFLYFKERYPKATVIPLTENYRSKSEVLDAAFSLMKGRSVEDVALIAAHKTGGAVESIVVEREDDEVSAVVERVSALIKEGTEPSEIAILVRKNRDIDAFARTLRANTIPFISSRDQDALESSEVMLLLALIRAAVDPYNDAALGKALFLPGFGVPPEVLARAFREGRKALIERLEAYPEAKRVHTFFLAALKRARTADALSALDHLVAESGFVSELMTGDDLSHALEAYRMVRTLIEGRAHRNKSYTLSDAISLLADLERGVATLSVQQERNGKGVRLMSLHKSKGLEFAHVFLPHAVESRMKPRTDRSLFLIPGAVSQPEPSWDDERRLFYVGLTRAKEHAYIYRHEKRSDEREEQPLPFLAELEGVKDRVHTELGKPILPTTSKLAKREEYDAIVREFLEHGISATALNAFLRDPWECFVQSVLKIPRSQEPHQLYGSAIHKALERFQASVTAGEDTGAELLVSVFKTTLEHSPLTAIDLAAYSERGEEALRTYYETYAGTFLREADTEMHIRAELPLPQGGTLEAVSIHGFIDKLERLPDGTVRVSDYKTGAPKSRNHIEGKTKDSDGDYKRQLVFYKLLLDTEGKHRMSEAVIDFVEPNDSGKHKREVFVISDEEVVALKGDIERMTNELLAGTFITKTSASENAEVRALAELLSKRFS